MAGSVAAACALVADAGADRDACAPAGSAARHLHVAGHPPPRQRADGPERVFGEWWKRDPELSAVRDYFQVEDEAGERFWIYRAGDGEDQDTGSHRWFLHGIFG